MAVQVAADKPDKRTGTSGENRFALYAVKDFSDMQFLVKHGTTHFSGGIRLTLVDEANSQSAGKVFFTTGKQERSRMK